MALITADDFAAVRAAINIELDEVGLPDAIISLPIYLGAADSEVKLRDPLWSTRTLDDLRHLKNAVIFFTAARIVLTLPRATTETFGQRYSYKIDQLSISDLASTLQGYGEDSIDLVLNPTSVDEADMQPTTFSLGQVCRPRFNRWGTGY